MRRSTRNERGATLLEFALVVPLLLLLAFGTAEMGLAWVTNNRVEGSTSTAARIASSSGSVVEADRSVLESLAASLPQEQLDNLDRVIIFKPTNATGGVPVNCIKPVGSSSSVGVSTQCNTYPGSMVRTIPAVLPDTSWAPSSRLDTLAGPPDYIGVWVRTSYQAKTGTFFDDMTITKTSIYRIQPDTDG